MTKHLLLFAAILTSLSLTAQMEIPECDAACTRLQKKEFNYCLNPDTYEVLWTAVKISGSNIENKIYLPQDSEFFTNIPQAMSKTWLQIENQVKFWSMEFDSVYVVTGETFIEKDTINPPTRAYYKAVLKGCQGDAIAFLVEENNEGKPLKSYLVSVDELEEITSFNFFPSLHVSLQEIIEPEYNLVYWPLTEL